MMRWASAQAATAGLISALLMMSVFVPAVPAAPDERGLWELWQKHANPPYEHEALLASCLEFNKTHSTDPLIVIGESLAGWHLLQLGRNEEAREIFSRLAGKNGTPLQKGAGMMAKAWLTRLDREGIKEALQFYYRKKIAYPSKLSVLAEYPKIPDRLKFIEKDHFGSSWSYELTGFSRLPGMLDQKYRLRSIRLGSSSDLAEALQVPCGELLRVEPMRMSSTLVGMEVLELRVLQEQKDGAEEESDSDKVILKVGSRADSVFLAYVGNYLVVVSDYHHWKVMSKPRAN